VRGLWVDCGRDKQTVIGYLVLARILLFLRFRLLARFSLVLPLVFLIFPALMVVILGPAVISVARQLFPIFNK